MREWLKNLRCEKNLSQDAIAKELGMSQQYYCMIEKGERQASMTVAMAEKIADVFRIAFTEVLEKERRYQMKKEKR